MLWKQREYDSTVKNKTGLEIFYSGSKDRTSRTARRTFFGSNQFRYNLCRKPKNITELFILRWATSNTVLFSCQRLQIFRVRQLMVAIQRPATCAGSPSNRISQILSWSQREIIKRSLNLDVSELFSRIWTPTWTQTTTLRGWKWEDGYRILTWEFVTLPILNLHFYIR